MKDYSCISCGREYPPDGIPYRCPACGGLYDLREPIVFLSAEVDSSQPGIWKYRHTFRLAADSPCISLGEGNTPLLWADAFTRKVAFKCEYLNPTGSFKDRGTTLIVSWLQARGISEAIEDSSGNAGSSLAAYSRRVGLKIKVFIPENASGSKRKQIQAFGAQLVPIQGSRAEVAHAVKTVADGGVVYASHAYLPFNLPGYAAAAYEIFEQLGNTMPGAVIVPAGQGGLLLGLARGFDALRIAYRLNYNPPKMIGVQVRACAPLWAGFNNRGNAALSAEEKSTLAEGVRVSNPLRAPEVLKVIQASQGTIFICDEDMIIPGREALARLGFYVEPTSAIVWSALGKLIKGLRDPVVVVLTGSGYKFSII